MFQSAQPDADPADGSLPRIAIEFVPARRTGLYQVADVALNSPLKNVCARQYQIFLGDQEVDQVQDGVAVCDIILEHAL